MEIITLEEFLSQKGDECDVEDPDFLGDIQVLIDTATDLGNRCAGLAFNQIGVLSRAFVIKQNGNFRPIVNPKYISKSRSIKSRLETCLSRPGKEPIRKRRHTKVKIEYYNVSEKNRVVHAFYAFEARVVQHEMDHLNGVLI